MWLQPDYVKVPASLLLDPHLTPAAKLVWLLCQMAAANGEKATHRQLAAASGLSRHSVGRGLSQRSAAATAANAPGSVAIPTELLRDQRLSTQEKLLYGVLKLTPGPLTYAELAARCNVSSTTVKRSARNLQTAGWLEISQRHKHSPIEFTLRNPAKAQDRQSVDAVARRIRRARYSGEAIMREYLTLLVDSPDYADDASPGFLKNPFTSEKLQLDRYYYTAGVAFEFQGPQHAGPTALFPDPNEAFRQQARDWMKQKMCAQRGIQLVTLEARDLSLPAIRQKIPALLPLRDEQGCEAVLRYLEATSTGYRKKANV